MRLQACLVFVFVVGAGVIACQEEREDPMSFGERLNRPQLGLSDEEYVHFPTCYQKPDVALMDVTSHDCGSLDDGYNNDEVSYSIDWTSPGGQGSDLKVFGTFEVRWQQPSSDSVALFKGAFFPESGDTFSANFLLVHQAGHFKTELVGYRTFCSSTHAGDPEGCWQNANSEKHLEMQLCVDNQDTIPPDSARQVCSDAFDSGLPELRPNAIEVTTSTDGSDPDGYGLDFDGPTPDKASVGENDTHLMAGLLTGNYEVTLTDLDGGCVVEGDNPADVTVLAADTVSVSFSITCNGSIRVITSTSGEDLDTGYSVKLDSDFPQSIGINDTITFTDETAGSHTLQLLGVASNCSVSGSNPRDVNVTAGATVESTFSVTCEAIPDPLSVVIDGPTFAEANVTCTWDSDTSGGTAPYTYEWKKGKVVVGTGSSYTAGTGTTDFGLILKVTDDNDETASDTHSVTVPQGFNCGPSSPD